MTKRHAAVALLVAVLLAVAAYWYWSPFLAVHDLQKAAQAGDAETFNAHVDYPKLRESLKVQLSDLLARKMGVSPDASNPLAALGGLIGQRLLNPLIDAMVRPDTVMAAMRNGQFAKSDSAPDGAPPAAEPAPAPGDEAAEKKPRWIIDRQGASRVTAYVVDPARPDEPGSQRLGLVFERSGFVDWKLTDIRLPAAVSGKP